MLIMMLQSPKVMLYIATSPAMETDIYTRACLDLEVCERVAVYVMSSLGKLRGRPNPSGLALASQTGCLWQVCGRTRDTPSNEVLRHTACICQEEEGKIVGLLNLLLLVEGLPRGRLRRLEACEPVRLSLDWHFQRHICARGHSLANNSCRLFCCCLDPRGWHR